MNIVEGLYYTKNHEWVKVEGTKATIGITDFAQHALGDIVYVEMPEIDDELGAEDNLGVVESVKAASDIFTPVSGSVVEINEALEDAPELINEKPYEAFIAVLELSDISELDGLLSASDYETLLTNTQE